jgi:hypothetical protein
MRKPLTIAILAIALVLALGLSSWLASVYGRG